MNGGVSNLIYIYYKLSSKHDEVLDVEGQISVIWRSDAP